MFRNRITVEYFQSMKRLSLVDNMIFMKNILSFQILQFTNRIFIFDP